VEREENPEQETCHAKVPGSRIQENENVGTDGRGAEGKNFEREREQRALDSRDSMPSPTSLPS